MLLLCILFRDKAAAMVVRIALLALCLALALPAPAVYAQDECEELDCDSSDEAVTSEETDPDDSSGEVADEASAEPAESEEESEESDASDAVQGPDVQADSATGNDDAAVDDDLSSADPDPSEVAPDEETSAASDATDESATSEEPSVETPVDAHAEPASAQSPEPAPATPAPADAAALQAFAERVGDCFLSEPVQVPAGIDPSQHPEIARNLYCESPGDRRRGGGQQLQIRSHPALFSLLGTTYGGDGKSTFWLPRFPEGYCLCLQGKFPARSLDNATIGDNERIRKEVCLAEKMGNPGFSGHECY